MVNLFFTNNLCSSLDPIKMKRSNEHTLYKKCNNTCITESNHISHILFFKIEENKN